MLGKLLIGGIVTAWLATRIGPAAWVLAAVAAVAWYVRDVKRHPVVSCRACKGSGANFSKIGGGKWFRRPLGDCWCCGGRKGHPRLALYVIDRNRWDEIRGKVARGRKGI